MTLENDLKRWRSVALAAGIAGAVLCAIGFFISPFQFYRSYLWSYLFIVGAVFTMTHNSKENSGRLIPSIRPFSDRRSVSILLTG